MPSTPSLPYASHTHAAQWWSAVLLGILLVLSLMGLSWLLRLVPAAVETRFAFLEAPSRPLITKRIDPTLDLKATLARTQVEERSLRVELATLENQVAKTFESCRRTAPPKPPPASALPEARWRQKDLSMFRGCWELGKEAPAVRGDLGQAQRENDCVMKAGRLCLNNQGQGEFEQLIICPKAGVIRCIAPLTAKFEADGLVSMTKPQVTCHQGALTSWLARTYSCRRLNDDSALCRSHVGRPGYPDVDNEFRRAP